MNKLLVIDGGWVKHLPEVFLAKGGILRLNSVPVASYQGRYIYPICQDLNSVQQLRDVVNLAAEAATKLREETDRLLREESRLRQLKASENARHALLHYTNQGKEKHRDT